MMKKILLIFGLICLISTPVFAADGDITEAEVKPDIATQRPHSITFYPGRKICKVVYNKLDASGNIIEKRVPADIIQNVDDDPETPEDETSTAYTALIANINNNTNFMISVKNRVKANR